MSYHRWKIAKLSSNQLLDIRVEDVLSDGWFRKCETYRGGGGYDQFPIISERVFGVKHHLQFIVQLFGCHLDCPYCYVTRSGVWGEFKFLATGGLVQEFERAYSEYGTTVFHLMGGAPALQLKFWPELIEGLRWLNFNWVFHSDLLLTEVPYPEETLKLIADHSRCLFAVDVKGLTNSEHIKNTRKSFREELFWDNLDRLERIGVPYYVTFTNVNNTELFWEEFLLRWPNKVEEARSKAFSIDLIPYQASRFVDSVPWGSNNV